MSAEVIPWPVIRINRETDPPNPGNGAREALIGTVMENNDVMSRETAENWADWVLAELWSRGFKVVPLE